ncbi:MAG: GDP-L-fucose synthase family protein [Dehalococcoidia bacterium]
MKWWADKRVVVTGGAGFLGSFVVGKLRERGCETVFVPRRRDYDLREKEDVVRLFEEARPDVVVHLAAVVGGIGANREHPGKFFYENAIMGIQMIESARLYGVEKSVWVGTVCSYPKFTPVPFKEENFWNGYPEETNAPYGLAKKMLSVQLQAYRQEYGFKAAYLIPVNLYGPGDDFDEKTSHVIPALIRKCLEAKRCEAPKIVVWGTGRATREFLYVEDAAEAIVLAAERYDKPDPVNLGSGEEINIRDLVGLIKKQVGYQGEVEWDTTKPDGQPRRRLDTARARVEFGWQAKMPFTVGLQRTIDWYAANYEKALAETVEI